MSHNLYMLRKITGPSLPLTMLHRQELVTRLQKAVGYKLHEDGITIHYKLVLLRAPAGYGKTTLLADFAHTISIPCCWYFLETSDANCSVFLRTLLASLCKTFPHFKGTQDLLPPIEEDSPTHIYQSAVDIICTAISTSILEPFVIFLCNYEYVNESKNVASLVSSLLKKLPSQVTVVIESRATPNLSIASLLAYNEMHVLDRDVLRFSTQEILQLATLQGHIALTKAEAEQLTIYFDGWIAGISLNLHLSKNDYFPFRYNPFDDRDVPFHQINPYSFQIYESLLDYITNEISRQDQEALDFLQIISIFQYIEPNICNALLGTTDAAQRLFDLEQQGLFIFSQKTSHQYIYKCHPVIRDLLSMRFRLQEPERFSLLHQQAAELWRSQENYEQAVHHALEINAYDIVIQLISDKYKQFIQKGQLDILICWLNKLPSTIIANSPRIILIQITIAITRGQRTTASMLLDKILTLIHENSNLSDMNTLQAEVCILRSKVLFQSGNYFQAQALCQQALILLPNDEIELRAAAEMRVGICAGLRGDFTIATIHLQRTLDMLVNQPPSHQLIDIHSALANIYYLTGRYILSEHHLTRALSYCEQLHDPQNKVNNLILKGIIHQSCGLYAEAETVFLQAHTLARTLQQYKWGEAYALGNLGSLYLEQRKYATALIFSEDGLELAYHWGNRSLVNMILANIALIHLFMGDPISALHFAAKIDSQTQSEKIVGYEQCWRELTYGMIHLYQGNYNEAYICLSEIEAELNTTSLTRGQLQAKLRLAACQIAQNRQEEGVRLLEEVGSLLTTFEYYKSLVLTELQWLPSLLPVIKSFPQLLHLRTILQIEAEAAAQEKASDVQTVSTSDQMRSDSPRLIIRAFGGPVVLLDGKPITNWRMKYAMELFFFLLNANHPLSKEQIVTAFWTELNDRTNQTFHSIIHHLRKLFSNKCIIFGANGYYLNLAACYGESIWYDVKEFQMLYKDAHRYIRDEDTKLAREAFLKMLESYRGDYGQSFYNDWCINIRDSLRTFYLKACYELAQVAWLNEEYEECIDYWSKVLDVDNCQEEAHYGIIRCYLYQDKLGMALRQYHFCKKILQKELGIQPNSAIQNLYQQIAGFRDPENLGKKSKLGNKIIS